MQVPEIPEEIGALSCDKIRIGCPLCAHAGSAPFRKMDELEMQLSGKVAPSEIYKAQVECYQQQIKPLLQHGHICPEVTEHDCMIHYTQHRVNVTASLAKEIVYCGMIQEHFRKNEMAQKTSEGEKINSRVLNDWVKISKHKLELIKQFRSMIPKDAEATSTSYRFT